MTIMDSTIAKNSSDGARGVGIYNTATMTVIASTILGNSGGGIYSGQGDTATLGATIVADNTGGPNCVAYDAGSFYSVGYTSPGDQVIRITDGARRPGPRRSRPVVNGPNGPHLVCSIGPSSPCRQAPAGLMLGLLLRHRGGLRTN
jgi:hypothetical protein